jgi:hypothetical protein
MRNECLDAVLSELNACGVRAVDRSYGSKHIHLRWQSPKGEPRMYSLPSTPSDVRSAANTRAGVRRILKEDGMLLVDRAPARPKPPDRLGRLEQRLAALELEVAQLRNGGIKQ